MKVYELREILKALPDNMTVTIRNDHIKIRGEYEATNVFVDKKQKTVEIETNYEKRFINERNRKPYDSQS